MSGWEGCCLLGISSINPPEDEARLTQHIWENYVLPDTNCTHLYRTTSTFTPNEQPVHILGGIYNCNY